MNGSTTQYLYGGEDILKEYDGGGSLQATYVHGPGIDEPIAMTRAGQTSYYHADGLGSIIGLTNSSEAIVQTYEYDSFGNITSQTGTVQNFYTCTGREFDAESGLYYYRARYYDANIGRFISADPKGLAGDLNLYFYVGNNPLKYFDPFGIDRFLVCENPVSKFICKKFIVPLTCKKNPIACCEVDFVDCATKAENGEEYLSCVQKRATCFTQAGKKPPEILESPPGWEEFPNPPGRGPKTPDPRFSE